MAKKIELSQTELTRRGGLINNSKNIQEYRRGLVGVILSQNRYTASELAGIMDVSERTVFEDLSKIRNPDLQKTGQWGGARNCLMSVEEEEAFLNERLESSTEGALVDMPKLHDEYNKRVGKITPRSTFYRLLKRHNWRKVKPDAIHPKADEGAQEAFPNKLSKTVWLKLTGK
jgi:transposase